MLIDLGECYTLMSIKKDERTTPVLSRRVRKAILIEFINRYASYHSLSDLTTIDEHYITAVAEIFSLDEIHVDALYKVDTYITETLDILFEGKGSELSMGGVLSLETCGEIVRVSYLPYELLTSALTTIASDMGKINHPVIRQMKCDTLEDLIKTLEDSDTTVHQDSLIAIREYMFETILGD